MASLNVLTFDAEGRAVDFEWLTRDAAARLAVRNHLPSTERAHFSQYKSARALYDTIVARYSSPTTAALSRLMVPYLFPDLAAFSTVSDLVPHLHTSDARYRAALPIEFLPTNSPPMYITLYYLVTRLPDSLSSVRDHFLYRCPTEMIVNLLEERLAAAEKDAWVDQFTPGGQHVTHCTCSRTGRHLATFTRRPGSSLFTLTTAPPPVPASGQVDASSQVFAALSRSSPASAPCSCRPLAHKNLLWHHRLGHPSLPRLGGMTSRALVSGLPRSLPPLPPGPAPTCVPCVEGRQRAAPHSLFPPTEAPLQTLHMDVWGPARVRGQGHERYFLLVVDDYSRYTTVFPLRRKGEVTETFTLPASPQQNGIAERRIGMVMDVARTSMIHAAAPHFLWPFAVQYAVHQINLQPRVSLPETTPTLRWTGKVGDALAFRV
ncbi:unnamed protein product [Closterium sp. NIES-54]